MSMHTYFQQKKIFVTGGGQGIGNALCKTLYSYGATVITTTLSEEKSTELKKSCPNIETIIVDLADWNLTRKALEHIDNLDGLVNNAGIAIIKPFFNLTEKDFDNTFDVNVKAIFNVTQLLAPKMNDCGSIVNMSSLASKTAFQDHTFYSASKAAVDALTKSMAMEFGKRNIRANSINPTVVLTEMGKKNWSDPEKANKLKSRIPLQRFCELDEVISCIVFLLSEQSSFINGHHLPVEGGFSAI